MIYIIDLIVFEIFPGQGSNEANHGAREDICSAWEKII